MSSGSDGEADSDADNVFLPTRANNPTTNNSDRNNINNTSRAVPKTLNLGRYVKRFFSKNLIAESFQMLFVEALNVFV